ncbi:hypothetical protein JD844_027765 [Phrynosoma platyrhinos]|uniref:RING-type domain-containing protein n=1 Tax=Phrynosoma platyrhinos TaxID=52577 RepID=A0ABQ7SGV2_PHRPL|nr:hypothetical protein JD844_027765 [Phrynosoma platyrhinos]
MSEVYNPALFEENLLSKKMAGVLVIPEGEGKDACSLETNFTIPPNTEDWIAFIARGGCTLKEKIKAAVRKGATGVLIYDHSCPDRESFILTHGEVGDIAIMISSRKVKQILRLIQAGIRVTAVIEASVYSLYNTKLLLHGGRWAKPEICYQILYKESLLSKKTIGMLVIPEGKAKDAFRPETKDNIPPNTKDRTAFIETGGSSFKAKVAAGTKATCVIYKFWDPDKETLILTHSKRGGIAVTLICHLKRKKSVQSERMIQDSIQATKIFAQYFWKICLCAFSLILAFAACILLYYTPGRIMIRREEQRVERKQRVETQLWKAVHSLELRKFKKGEFDLAGETCVVCLEAYKLREIVRILTCKHIFHKRCIDRWLLKRGTCPMCNCSIIQN